MVQLTGLALVERCRLADEPRGSSGGGKLNRHFFDLLVAGNELTVARGHGQHQPAMLATTHRLYEPVHLELRDREPSRSRRPQHGELIGDLQLVRAESEERARTAARRA